MWMQHKLKTSYKEFYMILPTIQSAIVGDSRWVGTDGPSVSVSQTCLSSLRGTGKVRECCVSWALVGLTVLIFFNALLALQKRPSLIDLVPPALALPSTVTALPPPPSVFPWQPADCKDGMETSNTRWACIAAHKRPGTYMWSEDEGFFPPEEAQDRKTTTTFSQTRLVHFRRQEFYLPGSKSMRSKDEFWSFCHVSCYLFLSFLKSFLNRDTSCGAENGGMLPFTPAFLAGLQGPCLPGLIWQQQIVFMAASPGPSISPASVGPVDSSRGHTVATETAAKSGNINDTDFFFLPLLAWNKEIEWHRERGMHQSRAGCHLFGQKTSETMTTWDNHTVWGLSINRIQYALLFQGVVQ